MSKLYVFGDSYSTPNYCVEPRDSWWGLLAQDLGQRIQGTHNFSWPGNNIDSIAHVIVSNISLFQSDDYIVIGIPPLQRLTMFNPEKEKWPKKVIFDQQLTEQDQEDVLCHRGLAQYGVHEMDQQFVLLWNASWIEAQTLRSLLTLDVYITAQTGCRNIVFLNLAVPFQPLTEWPVLRSLQTQALDNDRMLLFNDTYYTVNLERHRPVDFGTHGWFGHHGPAGNRNWYDSTLRPMFGRLGWL